MRRPSRRIAAIAAATVGIVSICTSLASAASGSGDFTATCDPARWDYSSDGTYYNHAATGSISVKQTDSSPSLQSKIALVSSNGNWTEGKAASNGGKVSWSGTLAGKYKVAARSASEVNCNGAWPGNGNYHFYYSITY